MPRVYNRHHGDEPKDAIYVGRPTRWGNPFKLRFPTDRQRVLKAYREWVYSDTQDAFRAEVKRDLKGKDLVCWCAPKPCHAYVLMEIANAKEGD